MTRTTVRFIMAWKANSDDPLVYCQWKQESRCIQALIFARSVFPRLSTSEFEWSRTLSDHTLTQSRSCDQFPRGHDSWVDSAWELILATFRAPDVMGNRLETKSTPGPLGDVENIINRLISSCLFLVGLDLTHLLTFDARCTSVPDHTKLQPPGNDFTARASRSVESS